MKQFVFLILAFGGSLTGGAQAPWHEFVQEDGSFRILFPQEPTVKYDTLTTNIGDIIQQSIFLQETDTAIGAPTFLLNIWEYPDFTVHSDSAELVQELLETTVSATVEELAGDLRYQTKIAVQGFPGLLWRVDYLNEEATLKTQAFVVENRLYSIQIACMRSKNHHPSINRFLDSFALLTNVK